MYSIMGLPFASKDADSRSTQHSSGGQLALSRPYLGGGVLDMLHFCVFLWFVVGSVALKIGSACRLALLDPTCHLDLPLIPFFCSLFFFFSAGTHSLCPILQFPPEQWTSARGVYFQMSTFQICARFVLRAVAGVFAHSFCSSRSYIRT